MCSRAFLVLLFSLVGAFGVQGQTYVSTGTGGEFLSNARIVSSSSPETLTDITGSLALVNGTSTGNLFEIYISNPAQFSASTTNLAGGENAFDTQLFLFDSGGRGIEANDDDPNTGQEQSLFPSGSSYLSGDSAGDYYLLIEGSGRYATDSSGQLIFPNFTDGTTSADAVVGPTGPGGADPLGGFTGFSNDGGNYSIALTGADFILVPEPSGLALAGIAGLVLLTWKGRGRMKRIIRPAAGLCILAVSLGSAFAADNLGRGLRPLVEEYKAQRAGGRGEMDSFRAAVANSVHAQADKQARVLVDVLLDGKATPREIEQRCAQLGGTVTASADWYRHGLLSAWLPITEVEQLAGTRGVSAVHLAPRRRVRVGAATSQGAVVHKTNLVNNTGYLGAGVTVGVLSDSYNDDHADDKDPGWTTASADVKTEDLPGTGNPSGYTTPVRVLEDGTTPSQDTDEGRAMLQIVHDVAPAANLAFCTAGNTDAEMAANITKLRTTGSCKVICDDTGFYDEPMFSDGVIAQSINTAAAAGVAYFSAIGNDGHSGYQATFNPVSKSVGLTQAAAEGVTTSSIPSAESGAIYEWHSFGTDSSGKPVVVQNITAGEAPVTLVFQWDDPFDVVNNSVKGVTTDYDILVFNSAGKFSARVSGTENNFGTNEPLEVPAGNLTAGATYKICIVLTTRTNPSAPRMATHIRYLATNDVDVITGDYITLHNVAAMGHPYAAGCAGVAAYDYDDAPDPGNSSHTYTPLVEGYSSNGPVDIYFDSAGSRLATPITRKQPMFSCADNVDTTFFPPSRTTPNPNDYDGDGFPNFAGTSAATPHAAGIAALLMNAAAANNLGTLSPQEIQAIMIATTQGNIDEDPLFISGTAGPVTFNSEGDGIITYNTFNIAYTGSGSQPITSASIGLAPDQMHFDTSTSNGLAFTTNSTTGSPAPTAGTPTYSGGSTGKSTIRIPFTNFGHGDSYNFSVGFDDDDTDLYGYDADELEGATISATINGVTYNGTLENRSGRFYNFKSGFGLLDAQAAVNLLLSQ